MHVLLFSNNPIELFRRFDYTDPPHSGVIYKSLDFSELHGGIITFSIYTLSDLGDLSNLTGSLSRTIQQYSPPNEWIMCELGVPFF